MTIIKGNCPRCGRENMRMTRGICHNCYRRFVWQRKKVKCKRCGREKPMHALGYCAGCYNFVFHLAAVKQANYKRWYGLELETYSKITEKCVICGFDKIVDLHHLDQNTENNSELNLIGLCPNHHRMLHNFKYRAEMFKLLKEKGYNSPEDIKLSFKERATPEELKKIRNPLDEL